MDIYIYMGVLYIGFLWVLIEHLIEDGPVTVSNESKLVNQPPIAPPGRRLLRSAAAVAAAAAAAAVGW